jgi:hypothetical protein
MVRAVLAADVGSPAIRRALSSGNTPTNPATDAGTNPDRDVERSLTMLYVPTFPIYREKSRS